MTTTKKCLIPYRIDLAGGWIDQPFLSRRHSGSVLTVSIKPSYNFENRTGMATSTRRKAIELWNNRLPEDEEIKLAKILFAYDNPPGSETISGAQDSIGIVCKGITNQFYAGNFWPQLIEQVLKSDILEWLEKYIVMIPLGPRSPSFNPLKNCDITQLKIEALALSSEHSWYSIKDKNIKETGKWITASFDAQCSMFPEMLTADLASAIAKHKNNLYGYKVSGAGGGGYLIGLTEDKISDGIRVEIRK